MTREQAVHQAQEIVRKSIKSDRSLVDALLRDRRAEVAREAKVAREVQKTSRRPRPRGN
jgi:hypothetical protein